MNRLSGFLALVAFLTLSIMSPVAFAGEENKKEEKKGGKVVVFGEEKKEEKKGGGK
jgi:lipopolysaccharide export LptBFGC system permease protein LptF